jgi:hypothetical protein
LAHDSHEYADFAYKVVSGVEHSNRPPLATDTSAHEYQASSHTNRDRSLSPFRTPPSTPPRLSAPAASAGTPLSAARYAALRREEQRGRELIAQALVPEPFDMLQDDDWEVEQPELDDEEVSRLAAGHVYGADESEATEAVPRELNVGDGSGTGDTIHEPLAATSTKPVAKNIPLHKLAENIPDPFLVEETPLLRPPVSTERIHPMPGVFMIYMLVSWLHLQFHLPFRACNAILGIFGLIMHAFGVVLNPPALSTLLSVMAKMELEPDFCILPVCPACLEVYPEGKQTPNICSRCNNFLYKARAPNACTNRSNPPTPLLRFPFKTLESQLVALLAVPGIEAELDKWHVASRKPGVKTDIYDGNICKNLKGHDGQCFFRNNAADKNNGPDGELRIGVTLGVDW